MKLIEKIPFSPQTIKNLFVAAVFVFICLSFVNAPDEFVFVDNGTTDVPVILYKDAPPRTVEAAREFVDYIQKITGARPKLIIGEPGVMPKKAVWLGYQPKLKSLFTDVDFSLKQEEILITANKNHLVILGRDKWDAQTTSIKTKNKDVGSFQKEYGTVNAIYTFLQDYLDVRWFMPGELGEDIITAKRIAFKPFIYRYSPQIKARSDLFITMSGREKETASERWSIHNRVYCSSELVEGGHPFVNWWEKYSKPHPDIFALTEKGDRKPLKDPIRVKLCVSNKTIDALWLKGVEEDLIKNPYKTVFSANENDDYGSGYCTCPNCRKLDAVDMFSKKPNLSDRHLHFANRLATALKNKYPDKGYKVAFFAYGLDRPLPLRERPLPTVVITSVSNFHLRRESLLNLNDKKIREYLDWSKIANEMIWRPNLGNPVGMQWGMPDVAMTQAFEDFQCVAENKCTGLFFDSFLEHWATQGPQYYVVARLSWDPYLDKSRILNDYYDRYYGAGATEMKSYWELMEKTRQDHLEKEGDIYGRLAIPETYTKTWFDKAFGHISRAKARLGASKTNAKYLDRLEFTESGLKYCQLIVKARTQMLAYEKGSRAGLKEAKNTWDEINSLKGKMDPLSVNFKYMKYIEDAPDKGSYKTRMLGLLPSFPVDAVEERKIRRKMVADE